MVDSVNRACDVNCHLATGNISYEYEPYYIQMLSDVQHNDVNNKGTTPGNAQVLGVIYNRTVNEQTMMISTTNQLPPECADNAAVKPSYCADYQLPTSVGQ